MPSELPILARCRHHWIVLLRPPGKWAVAAMGVLLVWGLFAHAVLLVLLLLLAVGIALRVQTWRAEQIILTRQRVIRVQGVPETTSSEAFLRVDRVSGLRIIQTVPGKLLNYASIELEAPGQHPEVRHLMQINRPYDFYAALRKLMFFGPSQGDPDEGETGPRPSPPPGPGSGPPDSPRGRVEGTGPVTRRLPPVPPEMPHRP